MAAVTHPTLAHTHAYTADVRVASAHRHTRRQEGRRTTAAAAASPSLALMLGDCYSGLNACSLPRVSSVNPSSGAWSSLSCSMLVCMHAIRTQARKGRTVHAALVFTRVSQQRPLSLSHTTSLLESVTHTHVTRVSDCKRENRRVAPLPILEEAVLERMNRDIARFKRSKQLSL